MTACMILFVSVFDLCLMLVALFDHEEIRDRENK